MEDSTKYAMLAWQGIIVGAGLLVVLLIAWFVRVLVKGRRSEDNKRFRDQSVDDRIARLGE